MMVQYTRMNRCRATVALRPVTTIVCVVTYMQYGIPTPVIGLRSFVLYAHDPIIILTVIRMNILYVLKKMITKTDIHRYPEKNS